MVKNITFSNNPLFSGPSLKDREIVNVPYKLIPLDQIERDPNQPRVNFDEAQLAELTTSIKTYGVISPILVKPNKNSKYTLIAGERRLRASTNAGLTSIPAIIDSTDDQTGERTLAIQLVENLQRSELTPLEKAYAISTLKESNKLSIRDIADKLGISKSSVQRSLDLLDLPDDLLNALRQGASESKIMLLAKIEDPKERAQYLQEVDTLTRSDLSQKLNKKSAKLNKTTLSAEDQRIADEIRRAIGLKIILSRKSPKSPSGSVKISFHNDSDLQHVFRKLIS